MKSAFLIVFFALVSCSSYPTKPSGTVYVYGDDRKAVVATLQSKGVRAVASEIGNTATKSPVLVIGLSFANKKLVGELRDLFGSELEVRESTYKNYLYVLDAGLFLHSEELISSGFAGSCTGGYVDITIAGQDITMVLSDWNGTEYGADRIHPGNLQWDGDMAEVRFSDGSTLSFTVGWNNQRMARTLTIQHSSETRLSGCLIVEKRVYG